VNKALLTDFHADGTYETLHQGIRSQVKALGLSSVWKEIFTAYLLATVKHETAGTFRPIEEIQGSRARYAPYFGRGFVQLTWLKNYQKYNDLLQLDMVANPTIACRSDVALFILVHGCYFGVFTGRGFNDYHSPGPDDFSDMRAIVNGSDRADLIAGYARQFLAANLKTQVKPSKTQAEPAGQRPTPLQILKDKQKPLEAPLTGLDATEPVLPLKTPDQSLVAFLAALGKLMTMFGHKA
jgi:hypothetical protein